MSRTINATPTADWYCTSPRMDTVQKVRVRVRVKNDEGPGIEYPVALGLCCGLAYSRDISVGFENRC